MGGLWAVLLATMLGSAPAAPSAVHSATALERLKTDSLKCPRDTAHCVGLALHVVRDHEGELVTNLTWLDDQLAQAHRHFAAIDVAFEVVTVDELPATDFEIESREHRDALGRSRFGRGVIHVFLVGQLDDVDLPGEVIRGVHWRQRSNIDKRWVIVSRIAMPMVMAHEFGHFFGLPHSSYPVSIMNKTPREKPPRAQRTFHGEEVEIIRRRRSEMLRDGSLRARSRG